jgi:hypothetical protein
VSSEYKAESKVYETPFRQFIDEEFAERNPAVRSKLKSFDCDHLNIELKDIVQPYRTLAVALAHKIQDSPWLTTALHKLWESKNEAVMGKIEEQL